MSPEVTDPLAMGFKYDIGMIVVADDGLLVEIRDRWLEDDDKCDLVAVCENSPDELMSRRECREEDLRPDDEG